MSAGPESANHHGSERLSDGQVFADCGGNQATVLKRANNCIKAMGVYLLLVCVYSLTWFVSSVFRCIPRRRWKPNGRILVTGTFHNPGWYQSHLKPLTLCGVREVILVTDGSQDAMEGIRFVCPPRWLARLISRAGAKAVWMIGAGLRYRPDLYMGYHIMPNACLALVAGSLFGRPTSYQATGGPTEIIGGGYLGDEAIGAHIQKPSKLLEMIALATVAKFNSVVVRGRKAESFFRRYKVKGSTTIITGSVEIVEKLETGRYVDLVYVGRLARVKQVDQFIRVVHGIVKTHKTLRVQIIGDGPLMSNVKAMANMLDVSDKIEFLGRTTDVQQKLASSKIFILTSRSEGLSIALAEAMAAGCVPVVADVGELRDLVASGKNGYLVTPNAIDEYVQKVRLLLTNQSLWRELSARAIESATSYCGVGVTAEKWRRHFREVLSRFSGFHQ